MPKTPETTPATPSGISRRSILAMPVAAAGAAALGAPGTRLAFAQGASVTAVMPGVFIPDAARAVITDQTGIALENVPYVSPTDTLAKLLAPGGTGRYDLMISVTEFVRGPVMGASAGSESAMALDMAKIPNAASIAPLFADDVVTRDGRTYLLPLVWGYDSVIYNRDRLDEDSALTQSWGVLFDDAHAGRVALRDDAYQSIMLTALHLGHEDPAAIDATELNEVVDFLIAKKGNFRTLWSAFGEAVNLIASGEVDALYGWISMRAALAGQGHNVANNWPSEGLLVWSQSAFVPADSPNAEAAHEVIDAMLSLDYGQALVGATDYPTTSAAVAESFPPEERARLGLDIVERGVKIVPMGFPENLDRWIEAWGRFKAA